MEMSYIKQGEEALQKSLRILEDQNDWKTETVAVGALPVVLVAELLLGAALVVTLPIPSPGKRR